MRKLLLASAAILGATGGLASAQDAPNPTQGSYAAPLLGGPVIQNNNNSWGTAQAAGSKVPAPGTVVIRLNGRVYTDVDLAWTSGSKTSAGALGAGSAGYKLNPVGVATYFRLYPGIDGMATNGLRYGASVEIRQNFMSGSNFTASVSQTATTGSAASASGNSSSETLFVRRAFVYFGSDQAGIVRIGQQDGLPGIYDATGIFTTGSWDGGIGNLNNGGFQANTPNQYLISWAFLSGNGTEYGNSKIVYLTPSFFGLDFGLEYSPSMGNALTNSVTSSPYQNGTCLTASANCISLSAGSDSTRWINRAGIGGRYTGSFAGLDIKGYAVYVRSGKESIAGGGVQASPAALVAGTAAGALKYDGQNFVNGGLAMSFAGVTLNGDFTIGRINGSNAMAPAGGVDMKAFLVGASYAMGPFSVGADAAIVESQGDARMVKTSQRHEFAVAVGAAYKLAPGITLAAEYQYEQKHQGGVNFTTGAVNTPVGNDIHGQGVNFATIVSW